MLFTKATTYKRNMPELLTNQMGHTQVPNQWNGGILIESLPVEVACKPRPKGDVLRLIIVNGGRRFDYQWRDHSRHPFIDARNLQSAQNQQLEAGRCFALLTKLFLEQQGVTLIFCDLVSLEILFMLQGQLEGDCEKQVLARETSFRGLWQKDSAFHIRWGISYAVFFTWGKLTFLLYRVTFSIVRIHLPQGNVLL